MLKRIKLVLFTILITFLIIPNVNAKEKVNLYLFWGDGCPHCAAEEELLTDLENEYENLSVTKYEVWYHSENNAFLQKIAASTERTFRGVPVTIVGQTIITGFSTETEQQIRRAINYYSENEHHDIVQEIKNGTYQKLEDIPDEEFEKQEQQLSEKTTLDLPIVNEIDFKNFELTTAIPILGLLASISLPVLWLIVTFASIVSIQKEKKNKLRLLSLGLVLIALSSLLSAIVKINMINWIFRILILLISLLLVLNKLKKVNIPNSIIKIITILLAIMIGWLTPTEYWNILNEVINTRSLSIIVKVLSNIYFLISYLIPYILILLICHIPWKKISEQGHELIQISVLIATMILIIFI